MQRLAVARFRAFPSRVGIYILYQQTYFTAVFSFVCFVQLAYVNLFRIRPQGLNAGSRYVHSSNQSLSNTSSNSAANFWAKLQRSIQFSRPCCHQNRSCSSQHHNRWSYCTQSNLVDSVPSSYLSSLSCTESKILKRTSSCA
ncbi:Hypothetical_protein [Hexamita inflata]|uniref:Hypothetical_protein n=1 Tax=Hexamita inflata TaxID=28002 RepID=A0AA86P8J8_9EUKA|nr:Hypothetical protein HINF_LOCUS21418 [Hexamita inflata]